MELKQTVLKLNNKFDKIDSYTESHLTKIHQRVKFYIYMLSGFTLLTVAVYLYGAISNTLHSTPLNFWLIETFNIIFALVIVYWFWRFIWWMTTEFNKKFSRRSK